MLIVISARLPCRRAAMEWLNIESQDELVDHARQRTANARSSADARRAGDPRTRANDHPTGNSEGIVRAD
jgi:hypothetical protein